MLDDAISNYKRNTMTQTSAIKFIHRTIVRWVRKVSWLFIKMPQNIFKTAKFAEHLQHRQTKKLVKRFET